MLTYGYEFTSDEDPRKLMIEEVVGVTSEPDMGFSLMLDLLPLCESDCRESHEAYGVSTYSYIQYIAFHHGSLEWASSVVPTRRVNFEKK